MTRKTKKSNTPVTWYGGRFPCRPAPLITDDAHVVVWGTMNKIIARRIVPTDAPDSVLLELYNEAIGTHPEPQIIHLIDEKHLSLFPAKATLKSGKRAAFLDLIDSEQDSITTERIQAHNQKSPFSYLKTGATPEQIGSFVKAASALYRVKPWETFTCSGFEFNLHAPAAQMDNCLLEMEAFVFHHDKTPIFVLALSLDEERDVSIGFFSLENEATLLEEIAAHQWEVPEPDFFPKLYVYQSGILVEANANDVRVMRVVCEALLPFITRHRHLTLLPRVTPVTEVVSLSWISSDATAEITGPHPEFDYEPYEPSSYEFDESQYDEKFSDEDFEDDETIIKD